MHFIRHLARAEEALEAVDAFGAAERRPLAYGHVLALVDPYLLAYLLVGAYPAEAGALLTGEVTEA